MRLQITLLLLKLPLVTFGAVNMKDASYQRSFADTIFLERSYSSRSLYNGLFGFGWCSNLESRLQVEAEKIKLIECEKDTEYLKAADNTYHNHSRIQKIEHKNGKFFYYKEGRIDVFDDRGRLIQQKIAGKDYQFRYRERLESVRAGGISWKIDYESEHSSQLRITSISNGKLSMKYEYSMNDLIRFELNGETEQSYRYDRLHNLVEVIEKPRGSRRERLKYDPDQDWVVERQRRDGCLEKYKYERAVHEAGPKEVARAEILCGLKTNTVTYEFFYHGNLGGVSLARVRSIVGTEVTDINLEGDI